MGDILVSLTLVLTQPEVQRQMHQTPVLIVLSLGRNFKLVILSAWVDLLLVTAESAELALCSLLVAKGCLRPECKSKQLK